MTKHNAPPLISTNILFDIGGVLFQAEQRDQLVKTYSPIMRGIELLKKCHQKRDAAGNKLHKLYILSNWKTPNFLALQEKHPDIFCLFEGYVISGDVGFAKPDRRIYQHFLEKFLVTANNCIFIDDALENVQAAHDTGIRSIHCDNFSSVEKKLSEMSIF